MLRRPFCGQVFQDAEQVHARAPLHVRPSRIGVVIFALHAFIETLQRLLDSDGLLAIRVSVQRMATGFLRSSSGMPATTSTISEASIVLSLPPLKPTSQGRGSSRYRWRRESLMSL